MHYRTSTYVAFDGQGTTNPSESDFKYYALVQAWSENPDSTFRLVNSHDKTSPVRDTSSDETLKTRLRERLSYSKNMIVILGPNTRKEGSLLSYEIEQAVDRYELPLIIAYTDTEQFNSRPQYQGLSQYWPKALAIRIRNKSCKAVHIPFEKDSIEKALNRYGVNQRYPHSSLALL